MDNFIVRQGQHEILGERIEHAEQHFVVMVLAMDRTSRHVDEGVVHPAHVPLEAEAEPAQIGRPRYHRPGRGFLGDGLHVGISCDKPPR